MSNRKPMSPKMVALYGVLIALVAVMTLVLIPIPATRGYFNLGEAVIFFIAFIFGRKEAAICGAIGAALIDAIYAPHFIPATLIAKGLEGFAAGTIVMAFKGAGNSAAVRTLGFGVGGSLMVVTYFVYEWLIFSFGLYSTEAVLQYGAIGAALLELPFNIIQALLGGIIALMLAEGIERSYPPIRHLAD